MCDYCFRHLEYGTPFTDSRFSMNNKLPYGFQPMNASLRMQSAREEIDSQKGSESLSGLIKIIAKLEAGEIK